VWVTDPRFDHLVVIMFENRSFDNLFGYPPEVRKSGPGSLPDRSDSWAPWRNTSGSPSADGRRI
jgi:phospholipase C